MAAILVVDDNQKIRRLIDIYLRREGFSTLLAETGDQALHLLGEQAVDLMIVDIMMPGMDGYALVEEMKCRGWLGKVPVLIISSENAVDIENKCFDMGVSDFIHKPFEASIVKNRIKNAVELFACKNQLEREVERQTEALRKQSRIIQMQAEQLQEAEAFHTLMMQYRCAIMEVETKL